MIHGSIWLATLEFEAPTRARQPSTVALRTLSEQGFVLLVEFGSTPVTITQRGIHRRPGQWKQDVIWRLRQIGQLRLAKNQTKNVRLWHTAILPVDFSWRPNSYRSSSQMRAPYPLILMFGFVEDRIRPPYIHLVHIVARDPEPFPKPTLSFFGTAVAI